MAKKNSKKKPAKKQSKPKSLKTPASDDAFEKMMAKAGQPRDNVQYEVYKILAPILAPKDFKRDQALLAEKRDAFPDRAKEIRQEQKELKAAIVATIHKTYPKLQAMIDNCPPKTRDGSGAGRTRKPRSSGDYVSIQLKAARTLQRDAAAIIADRQSAADEAQHDLDKALRGANGREKKRDRIDNVIAQTEAKIARLKERLQEKKAELKALESDKEIPKLQTAADIAAEKLDKAKQKPKYQQVAADAYAAQQHVAAVAAAVVNDNQTLSVKDGVVLIS